MRWGAVTAFLLLESGSARAVEIASCGVFVPAGETATLTTDLVCGRTSSFPFSAQGVVLDGDASLALDGHSITGDGSGVGVGCMPQSRRAFRLPCRVTGPGEISGFELGIGVVGVVAVEGVTVRRNRFGVGVQKCCELRLTDVVADENEVAGIAGHRVIGARIQANGNGEVGISGGRLRLAEVTATGNGAGGGVQGRGRVVDSLVTGNAGFDGSYDLLAYSRIRTRRTTCGRGIRLRTIFEPDGGERTKNLGDFVCR